MASPVVVQGTPVSNPHTAPSPVAVESNGGAPHGGEKQETRCNDPIFALLFYACIAAIVGVACVYGPTALNSPQSDINYQPYIIYAVVISVVSIFISGLALSVMMCIPETLIKISLIFVTVMAGVWAAMAFVAGSIGVGVIGVIFFLISICYAWAVWSRIPFASVNLVTAITSVKANMGVVLYAYIITAMAGLWSFTWSVAFVGILDKTYQCNDQGYCSNPNYGYLFLLFLAFFFGHQVFQYSIHVIVAGTVGTWWYEPSESGCCGSAINNSFLRTITTSFGSICFGSFIVAILQALRMLANSAQSNGDANFLACIAECILACLASIVEYLNKWAFVYVGIYGFSYIKAAKNVFTLFQNRGWEAIIADDLVSNTLLLVSLIAGAIIGSIGILIQVSTNIFDEADLQNTNVKAYVFVLGFFIGLVITSILMSVIGSGVNTVIVLFAEAPAEFQQNYPELSRKMREVWSTIYPGSV